MGCGSSTTSKAAVPGDINFDGPVSLINHEGASPPPSAPTEAGISFAANLGQYGGNKFKGKEASKYLAKQKLTADVLNTAWTRDEATADKVAAAMVEWAKDHGKGFWDCPLCPSLVHACRLPAPAGATMATHVFQPLGSGMMRLGQTGQVHMAMFNFKQDGSLGYVFDGNSLLHGETDGSSYLNGGMRATHTAGGYTACDPSCPAFIRGDTVFIPTVRGQQNSEGRRFFFASAPNPVPAQISPNPDFGRQSWQPRRPACARRPYRSEPGLAAFGLLTRPSVSVSVSGLRVVAWRGSR